MTYQAAIFDLDGTLIDSVADIAAAANAALLDLGRSPRLESEVRTFVGDGVVRLMERCLGTTGPVQEAVRRFREHYAAGCLDQTVAFSGITEMLADLAVPLAVISNKPEGFCRHILAGLGLEAPFDRISGGDTFAARKPAPEPVISTLEALSVRPAKAVVIGDGWQDMAAGSAAGTATIGVLWGLGTGPDLTRAGAQQLVANVNSLRTALGLPD